MKCWHLFLLPRYKYAYYEKNQRGHAKRYASPQASLEQEEIRVIVGVGVRLGLAQVLCYWVRTPRHDVDAGAGGVRQVKMGRGRGSVRCLVHCICI